MQTIPIKVKEIPIKVKVAMTRDEQTKGLQGCNNLPEDGGMLFQYPKPQLQSFWMKDVPIPLSIAFIDESRKIVKIVEGKPFSLDKIKCPIPCKWVLEMNGGWFGRKGIGIGSRVQIPQLQQLQLGSIKGSVKDLGGRVSLRVIRKK